MSELQLFPSDDEFSSVPETPALHLQPKPGRSTLDCDPLPNRTGRQLQRSYKPRSRRPLSPPPSRPSSSSVSSSPSPPPPQSLSQTTRQDVPLIPPVSKWTVNSLRQALANSGVHFPRRSSKIQLYELLTSSQNSPSQPELQSKNPKNKIQRISTIRSSPRQQSSRQTRHQHERANPTARTSSFAPVSSRLATAAAEHSSPAAPAPNNPQVLFSGSRSSKHDTEIPSHLIPFSSVPSFLPNSQKGVESSVRLPPLNVPPPLPFPFSSGDDHSVRMPPQSVPPISLPIFHSFPPAATHTNQDPQPSTSIAPARWPSHSLASAEHLPPPPHAVAQEPPPVSSQLRSLILAGADIDLPSLLTSVPINESHRSFECGP
ncbi:histone-lysine N-methyltransferase 2D-like [Megalobrama amblycephala]|uniref:histone-lysine N-methyltransferase 2D-like n=1 Tax=Megalobrama amblycephala TaxID=75352 RepID=UPI0020141884|nr:histone-lysine N-methyltransferase 2D-like [Megalobrama amblycephala]